MHEVLVNRLGVSLPRKSVVRLTDRPDTTLDVYRGRKTIQQQQQQHTIIIDKDSSIQMKCQEEVIFAHAPRYFYCPKRRIGYASCSLTGNKNFSAIIKVTNTM